LVTVRKLEDKDKEEFINFINAEEQKNSERRKPRPWLIDNINFNASYRQCFGAFDNGELVATCAINHWPVWPWSTLDTLVVKYGLPTDVARQCFNRLTVTIKDFNEEHNIFAIWAVRDLRQAKALMRSKDAFYKDGMLSEGYMCLELGIIPANKKSSYFAFNKMLEDRVYPVDMHIGVYIKDPEYYPKDWYNKITYAQDTD